MKIGPLRLGRPSQGSSAPLDTTRTSLIDTIGLLRRYVVQETVAPLKHLGRVLAFGASGALLFGLGGLFLVVGVLRLVQAESGSAFAGNWSFAPYLFAAVVGIGAVGLFAVLGLRGIRDRDEDRVDSKQEEV